MQVPLVCIFFLLLKLCREIICVCRTTCSGHQHDRDWSWQPVLDKEDHVSMRRIKDVIRIHQRRPELNWILAWTSHPSSSNSCHMIQKSHVTLTATKLPSPDEGREILPKFWEFFHHLMILTLHVRRMCDQKLCFQSPRTFTPQKRS